LVYKGYAQIKGVDFEETFAPLDRLEVIIIFLSLSIHNNIKVYHMDVKSGFIDGYLEEEAYIEHP